MVKCVQKQSRLFLVYSCFLYELASCFKAKEAMQALGCTCKSIASRPQKEILFPLHSAFETAPGDPCPALGLLVHNRQGFPGAVPPDALEAWASDAQGETETTRVQPLEEKAREKGTLLVSITYLEDAEKAEPGSSQRHTVIQRQWTRRDAMSILHTSLHESSGQPPSLAYTQFPSL